jgi:hypothetical protein
MHETLIKRTLSLLIAVCTLGFAVWLEGSLTLIFRITFSGCVAGSVVGTLLARRPAAKARIGTMILLSLAGAALFIWRSGYPHPDYPMFTALVLSVGLAFLWWAAWGHRYDRPAQVD